MPSRTVLWNLSSESLSKSKFAKPPNQFVLVLNWLNPKERVVASMKPPDVRSKFPTAGFAIKVLQVSIQTCWFLTNYIKADPGYFELCRNNVSYVL
jgi:hypothetical protein